VTDNLSGQAITPGQRLFSLHCDHDDPEGSWLHLRPKYRDRWERTARAFNAEAAATLERVERERDACAEAAVERTQQRDAAEAQVEALSREGNQRAEDLLRVGTELGRARKALEDVRAITSEALADSPDDPQAGRTFFLSIVRLVRNRIENALSAPAEEKKMDADRVHADVASRFPKIMDALHKAELAEESSSNGGWRPSEEQIAHMVQRFLGWKLPEDFRPDAGVSFTPEHSVEFMASIGKAPMRHEPTGTNLFDARQAEAMVRHILAEMPVEAPEPEIGPPTPLGALRFRMEQGGHTQADLARLLGSRSRAAEVLSGKRSLSKAQIRRLVDEWGIPAESLLGCAAPAEARGSQPAEGHD